MKRLILIFSVFVLSAAMACACPGSGVPVPTELTDLIVGLQTVAGALGALMIAIEGVRWIIADNPTERSEAKKGIIYVIVGLIVVLAAVGIVDALYCANIIV